MITDGQFHWILNNSRGWDLDFIESLSFDDAFEVISQAKEAGYIGAGQTEPNYDPKFWETMKTRIVNYRSEDRKEKGNNYGLQSQPVAPSSSDL